MHLFSGSFRSHLVGKRARTSAMLLGLALLLVACGSDTTTTEDEDGPRFASDRRTEAVAPTATLAPTEVPATLEVATAPEPRDVLSVRSAPHFAYLVIDGRLTVYDAGTRTFVPVELPAEMLLVDHASSPTGDRVGVLGVQGDRLVVQFFGADGKSLSDAIALSVPVVPASVATPTASPVASSTLPGLINQMHLDWVPQGNAVLVSGPGVLKHVSMSGAVMPISRTGASGTVVRAIWSPMDSQVAIQTQMQSGEQAVYMLSSGHDESTHLDAFHDLNGQALGNLQWLPSGKGLVVVAGTSESGVVMDGQLFVYRFGDEVPTMIATSGQGGPNSTITHAAVSPDGHSVAYAVMVRDLNEWHLHSLWVRSLKGGPAVSIPVDSAAPLTSLLWTEEGLVWQQSDGTLMVVDTTLVPRPLGDAPAATPVATPVETPAVEATPRG